MKKVETYREALEVFDLLGIKNVTKECQRRKGTQVFELPFKTMYSGGYKEVNRFSVYESGYIRKMLVNDKGASYTCYQLNRVRQVPDYFKDYRWDSIKNESIWTGKYRKRMSNERILIDNHRDRMIYLCNYILKNYYRSQTGANFYRVNDYQVSLMRKNQEDSCELNKIKRPEMHKLPFGDDCNLNNRVSCSFCEGEHVLDMENPDVQIIINGHRYNLS